MATPYAWNSSLLLVLFPFILVASTHITSAEPVRVTSVTVLFTVEGDSVLDPDFGNDTASGSFTFGSNLILENGGVLQAPGTDDPIPLFGLGARALNLSWAGTQWSTANADVYRLFFDPGGTLRGWDISGVIFGADVAFNSGPDFSVGPFAGLPVGSPGSFTYFTPRSPELGLFSGRLTSWSVTETTAPIPEPTSVLLVGGALLCARLRLRRRATEM